MTGLQKEFQLIYQLKAKIKTEFNECNNQYLFLIIW